MPVPKLALGLSLLDTVTADKYKITQACVLLCFVVKTWQFGKVITIYMIRNIICILLKRAA
jgi:hypothetical protein